MDTQYTITTKAGIQKIGKPVSNELPQVKDPNINLRDRLNDFLSTEKHNLISYQTAINEIINDDLRGIMINNRNGIQAVHTRFFNELFNLGEYQADVASSSQIRDSFEVFQNYKTQFPYAQ